MKKDFSIKMPGYRTLYTLTRFEIVHNKLPDIFLTHIPEVSFIEFICNFGGLLGMWLGFSVWTILDDVTKLFIKFILKFSR